MEVKNTKKRNVVLAAVLLGVAATVGTVGVTTFAKYKSQLTDVSSNVTVAKWAFDTDNSSHSYTFNLANTYTASTLVSNRIAPGTQGSFVFSLNNANGETGVEYTIDMAKNAGTPANLKFYSDSACTTELTNGTTLSGHLNPNASATTVTVYWKWAYETGSTDAEKDSNDLIDTSNGKTATADGMTVTATITGVQSQPVAQ